MANPPPGHRLDIPVTKTPDVFPQWGVKQISGKPGFGTKATDYSVEKAPNATQKAALLNNGYSVWFGTQIDANNFVGDQTSNANNPVTKAANAPFDIAGFLKGLTNINLWLRVVKVLAGGALVIVGVAHMTGVDKGIVGAAIKAAPLL